MIYQETISLPTAGHRDMHDIFSLLVKSLMSLSLYSLPFFFISCSLPMAADILPISLL